MSTEHAWHKSGRCALNLKRSKNAAGLQIRDLALVVRVSGKLKEQKSENCENAS
jgi:hypothetical protein